MCLILLSSLSIAQTQRTPKRTDELENPLEDRNALSIMQPTEIALESTVDPEKYYVGPSDVIAVNIWMSPPISLSLTVSPEGTLIIPTVGELMLADQTLASAKREILKQVRKKYLTAEITSTLIKPRPIVVNIAGDVLHPGLLTLNAADRVNKAIEQANQLGRLQTQDDLKPILIGMSKRNIVLKHRDGSQHRVDIEKYLVTHEGQWNPYLREGDLIVVPTKDLFKNVFALYGQVNSPGRHEFVEGDSLLDAIRFAHGMTPLALSDQAILSRMSQSGNALATRTVNISEVLAARQPNIALEPGDRIIIRQKMDLRQDYNVDIRGEVLYPGTYPITMNQTRLSEVINQAGGFTGQAALNSAAVLRPSRPIEDIDLDRFMDLRGEPAGNDSTGFSLETDLRIHRAAVNVDFEKLFLENDSTQDIIVQAEDQVIIPSRERTVYVFGQVALPGHVPYVQGKESRYYVAKAGGLTDHANGGSIRIIKAKTSQWLEPGATRIEEGDYVWVPAQPDHPFSYYMTIAYQAATALSVIVSVVFIIQQAHK
jgi:protein involved in polysaccharide export with SLBB domain